MFDRADLIPGPTLPSSRPSYLRVLRTPSLALLWATQLVSQSGDYVFDVALLWFVLKSTGSSIAIALVSVAAFAPWIVLSPIIGTWVDESNRKTAIIVSNLVMAVGAGLLSYFVLVSTFSLVPILLLVLLLNSGGVAVGVATRAMVAHMVGRQDLSAANGLFFFSNSANQLLGFSIGGAVVAFAGSVLPIEYDALTFVVAAALAISLRGSAGAAQRDRQTEGIPPGKVKFFADLREGARYVNSHKTLRRVLWMVTFATFVLNGYTVLGILYVDKVLGGGAADYGLFLSSMAAGGLIGSIAVGASNVRANVGRFLFLGTGGLGAVTAALGFVSIIEFGLPLAFLLNASGALVTVSSSSWIQAQVPEDHQARVWGYTGITRIGAPASAAIVGVLASRYVVSELLVGIGLGVLVIVGVVHILFRDIRTISF